MGLLAVGWMLLSLHNAYVETQSAVWWYLEVEALESDENMKAEPSQMGFVPYKGEPEGFLALFSPGRCSEKRAIYKSGSGISPDTQSVGTLTSDFPDEKQISPNREANFCCF